MRAGITANILKLIDAGVEPSLFMFADHPSQPLFGWTGTHAVTTIPTDLHLELDRQQRFRFNLEDADSTVTFNAGASIIRAEGFTENEDIATQEVNVSLVGLDKELMEGEGFDFNADIKGRVAYVWLGWLNPEGNVVDKLVPYKSFELQYFNRSYEGGAFVYTLTGTPGFISTQAPTRLLWTPEAQRARGLTEITVDLRGLPTEPTPIVDTGFDNSDNLRNTKLIWAQGTRRTTEAVETTTPPPISVVDQVITQILLETP